MESRALESPKNFLIGLRHHADVKAGVYGACQTVTVFSVFADFMSRIAVIWISLNCLTYAMPICAPMLAENS